MYNKFLQFFYNGLLFGLPSITYNPINKNVLHAPFNVNEYSTYINYKLNKKEINIINNYLIEKTNNLKLEKISIFPDDNKHYFLSVNIYNCTSPIFSFIKDEPVTRCEINTYISNNNNEIGTLILDYTSNILSMDPDNIFKQAAPTNFLKDNSDNIVCNSYNKNINLKLKYNKKNSISKKIIDKDLIKYSDKIFYNNGIYDKLYFDNSLLSNVISITNNFNIKFNFLNNTFKKPHSIFFFNSNINFVGGLWDNLNK